MSSKEVSFDLSSKSIAAVGAAFKKKNRTLRMFDCEFEINSEASIFLSHQLYRQLSTGTQECSIDIEPDASDIDGFSKDEACECVRDLIALTDSSELIVESQRKLKYLAFIAGQIENHCLWRDLTRLSANSEANLTLGTRSLCPFQRLSSAKEFCFVVCGRKFECPRVLAAFLSKKAANSFASDHSVSQIELTLPPNCEKHQFSAAFFGVFSLLNGIPLKITEQNFAEILSISSQIENEELTSAIVSNFLLDNSESFIKFLTLIPSFSETKELRRAISFCASNFYRIDLDSLSSVCQSILDEILSSDELLASNEDQIFSFVQDVIQLRGSETESLLDHVQFRFLSEGMKKDFMGEAKGPCLEAKSRKRHLYIPLKAAGDKVIGLSDTNFDGRVEVPEGFTTIAAEAFKDSKISSIRLPSSIRTIEERAFEGCDNLASVKIPSGVESIGEGAFFGCSSLSEILIPSEVTEVKDATFDNCSSLKTVAFSESIESIGKSAFYGCASLVEIEIPTAVSVIQKNSFNGCTSLESVSLSENIEFIGEEAFRGCASLSEIELPEKVSAIDKNAFNGCKSLKYLRLPQNLEFIGKCAFYGCSSLSDISIEGMPTIDISSFGGCPGIEEQIDEYIEDFQRMSHNYKPNDPDLSTAGRRGKDKSRRKR